MARTEHQDPEAEKNFKENDVSIRALGGEDDRPTDDRLSLSASGNSMLRDRALGPHNVKVNRKNGY